MIQRVDCAPLLAALDRFCASCRTREEAAKRLGVSKGTITKWFDNQRLSVRSLKRLAQFEADAELADAARKVLRTLGIPITSFNFAYAASQLLCSGLGADTLFAMLEHDDVSFEKLESAAAHDLVSAFSDAQFYHTIAELAQDSFQQMPVHPLERMGKWGYEDLVFPDEDQTTADAPQECGSDIDECYKRRKDAARALLDCARCEPRHALFDRIMKTLGCRARERNASDPTLSTEECLRIAALASADCYRHESVAMEAADTIRRSANDDRSLERSPLYALAEKIYEICYICRTYTINRLVSLKDALADDKETIKEIEGECTMVYQSLYSEKGVYYSHGAVASAQVNTHGSVIDFESGRVVRSLVGKKRKAPKRAIVRDRSIPRRPSRSRRVGVTS